MELPWYHGYCIGNTKPGSSIQYFKNINNKSFENII
nr:MAG TPA: Protein of unknown function (DUF3023) [Caudoviricetes sp.]